MTWTSATLPPAGTRLAAAHRAARRLARPSPRTATATWNWKPPPPSPGEDDEPSIPPCGAGGGGEEVAKSTQLSWCGLRRRERRGSNGRAGGFLREHVAVCVV